MSEGFLRSALNNEVRVVLRDGREYRGAMCTIDSFLSVVLKNVSEIISGEVVEEYDSIFLKGGNVLFISQ